MPGKSATQKATRAGQKALTISADCADAYLLLAGASSDEASTVEAGERGLRKETF
jgi:hypothetical protein